MTTDLESVLTDYRTGLDAELALLGDLEVLAARQHALPHAVDPDTLTGLAVERRRLLAAFAALELQVAPLRERLAANVTRASQLPGFAGIRERHHRAAGIVARIAAMDETSLAVLQQADAERRAAAQSLETGEATLAAYRRIVQEPPPSAGLFTQRG